MIGNNSMSIRLKALAYAAALLVGLPAVQAQAGVSPEEARTIAKEAYIYGYPMVDNYRIQYGYFVDHQNPEYKGPWNQIHNTPRVYTPADKAVQTPNSDTPYSWAGLDLRAEPIVLTIPHIEKNRYFSVQLTDLYTFNSDYISSRTTGNDGGSYLIVGPNWKGDTPKGIKKVFRAETDLTLAIYRTQLFNPGDIEKVKKVQAGYKVQTLSAFLGSTPAKAAPPIDFVKPLSHEEQKTSLQLFSIMNFLLQFCPTDPSEKELMARFAKIGIGAGKDFDPAKLSPEMKTAIEQGMADAWDAFAGGVKQLNEGTLTSGDILGSREAMKNNYLNRMLGTIGIYGASRQEAIYPFYRVDADKQKLDGSQRYSLRFAPDQLPPVNAFWSLTMYELPGSWLVDNPLNRYLINSPMLSQLKRDVDGGVTLYIQHESPGKDKEANWLPAPKGPFAMYMRLYRPAEQALSGKWTAPPLEHLK
ncbi:DUF1254 domain-containing protein [Pseudomonas arsenicoxydans]|uniref:DUF1254 domain-containing protein n=2 Tax=Pseudomonas arsenicoxydans TaxID=702115 RepID=A0A502H348_9PSED|nr:DUF1254 domain-containing protein [Pseudomonas arsenicoxydans]